jgi:hypothetical protein
MALFSFREMALFSFPSCRCHCVYRHSHTPCVSPQHLLTCLMCVHAGRHLGSTGEARAKGPGGLCRFPTAQVCCSPASVCSPLPSPPLLPQLLMLPTSTSRQLGRLCQLTRPRLHPTACPALPLSPQLAHRAARASYSRACTAAASTPPSDPGSPGAPAPPVATPVSPYSAPAPPPSLPPPPSFSPRPTAPMPLTPPHPPSPSLPTGHGLGWHGRLRLVIAPFWRIPSTRLISA